MADATLIDWANQQLREGVGGDAMFKLAGISSTGMARENEVWLAFPPAVRELGFAPPAAEELYSDYLRGVARRVAEGELPASEGGLRSLEGWQSLLYAQRVEEADIRRFLQPLELLVRGLRHSTYEELCSAEQESAIKVCLSELVATLQPG